jgi:hypothetical protein
LSCFDRDGFCTMTLSSGSKKSNQGDSDSDSNDEVHDELPLLCQENERLACCLIIVMTCLERLRRCGKNIGLHLRMLGLEWLS